MLTIFTNSITARLAYACDFIFKEQLGVPYKFCKDVVVAAQTGLLINYSEKIFDHPHFTIAPHGILLEQGVTEQTIDCFTVNDFVAFFKTDHGDCWFDVFAATFYLISRYEEYLPHQKDMYGRYEHENSVAFRENFLQSPVVDLWMTYLKKLLVKHFPGLQFRQHSFSFTPTYDIDIAYSYKGKGGLRNFGGFLKAPTWERLAVLLGNRQDPYDCYDFLDQLHKNKELAPLYFLLMAEETSKYDKNISPDSIIMKSLLQEHAAKYRIGIHPSWGSYDREELIKKEKQKLETISGKKIIDSRQHYIKFDLPTTFRQLINTGITDDYSVGYGSINGFRASTASSFFWYDLLAEKTTSLRLHPFCFMDANCLFEEKLSVQEAATQLQYYFDLCKKNSLPLVTIFHNNFLGSDKMYAGYREMYVSLLDQM